MSGNQRVMVFQPPSPPGLSVARDYAGGYGVATRSSQTDYGHEGALVPNVSLLYSAAILAGYGYKVTVVDGQAEELTFSSTLDRVREISPSVIITTISLPSFEGDLHLIDAISEHTPDTTFICIGTVCKEFYSKLLGNGHITAVVRGDAEVVLPHLLDTVFAGGNLSSIKGIAYKKENGEITATTPSEPLSDLNALPMPLYDQLPMSRYWVHDFGQHVKYMEILDSRGCPHQCGSYCPYPFGFGRKPLFRNAVSVVDEIEHLNKTYGTEAFIFRAQNFTMPKSHAEDICNEIISRNLHVRWLCETRLDSVNRPLLNLMKKAGCEQVHYGLESGDPELFARVGKPGRSLEELGVYVRETKQAGMEARVNVVLGLPGENWKTVRRTIKTLRQWQPSHFQAGIITPYPGTAVYEEAKRSGLLLSEDWADYTGYDPVMQTEFLSSQDLLKAKQMIDGCLDETGLCRRVVRNAARVIKAGVGV